jgi:hypothetical protein
MNSMTTLPCSLTSKLNTYEKKSIAKFKHRCVVSFQAFLVSVSNIKRPKKPSLYVYSDKMLACVCVQVRRRHSQAYVTKSRRIS